MAPVRLNRPIGVLKYRHINYYFQVNMEIYNLTLHNIRAYTNMQPIYSINSLRFKNNLSQKGLILGTKPFEISNANE